MLPAALFSQKWTIVLIPHCFIDGSMSLVFASILYPVHREMTWIQNAYYRDANACCTTPFDMLNAYCYHSSAL